MRAFGKALAGEASISKRVTMLTLTVRIDRSIIERRRTSTGSTEKSTAYNPLVKNWKI
jgi:hypothetical protein